MAGNGIDGIPIRWPEKYSAAFFDELFRETLALGDVRNAVAGTGVDISGTPDEPGTISASADVQAIAAASLLTATPSSAVNARVLTAGQRITLIDGGPGSTLTINASAAVAWGDIVGIPDDALSVIGNPTNADDILPVAIAAAVNDRVLRRTGDTLNFGQLTVDMAADALWTFAKLQDFDALSVLGRSANTSGVSNEIAAGTDNQVLRRSGTAIGFGAVNLASSDAVTGVLPAANVGAAAPDNAVQYRDPSTDTLAGDASLTYDPSTRILQIGTQALLSTIRAPTHSGTGNGGALTLSSGGSTTSGAGGATTIQSGAGAGASSAGGAVQILSGAGSGSGVGGNCSLTAGTGGATGAGGAFNLTSGQGGGTSGSGGMFSMAAGSATGAGNGGNATIQAGNAGSNGDGGQVDLIAGVSGADTNDNGGNVTITAGDATNIGGSVTITAAVGATNGDIVMQTATGGDVRLTLNGNNSASTGVQFNGYGAGAITSDASGNLTAVSDERIKRDIVPFTRGLSAVLALNPIQYGYTLESRLDQTKSDYAGFSAQNVRASIPEAVGVSGDGLLSFADRPIIAALVNAIKTLEARITALGG